jgi:outer membrane beta-barrel protein
MKKNLHLFVLILSQFVFVGSSYADENSLYDFKWLDEGEKVYVIQNKEHTKAGGIGIDFSFADSQSSPYQDTVGMIFGITYYFSETWSMDITYKKYNNTDSTDLKNLLNVLGSNQVKPIIRKIDSATLLHLNWIPFYGKVNTFNRIFFFDWGFGLGVGQFETQGNWQTFSILNKSITFEKENDSGFNFRSFVKFYAKANLTMGFEYNLTGVETIRDPSGTKEILYYNDIIASVGYLF